MVQKLLKVTTIKKQLSDRQTQHLQKLSTQKKGKKYVEKIEAKDIELPTEVVEKKPRAPRVKVVEPESESESEPEVVIIKKKKKKKKQVIIEESETESEEEEPIKPKKKSKPKPPVKAHGSPQLKLHYQTSVQDLSLLKQRLLALLVVVL